MRSVEEAHALVAEHGSKAAAARALGVPTATFKYWCNTERQRAKVRARYDALTGYEYNALLLRHRRTKALTRIRTRNKEE